MLFDSSTYICKTCRKKCQKCKISCQAVSNKLEVFDLPTEFQSIRKLERVLIAKHIIFKEQQYYLVSRWKRSLEQFLMYQ